MKKKLEDYMDWPKIEDLEYAECRNVEDVLGAAVVEDDMGIGKELLKRCVAHFPTSEWLVQTKTNISGYYEKNG